MPHRVKPMLATLAGESFDDSDWVFEVKWDGYRAVAEVAPGKAKLYSRNLQPFNDHYPPVVEALAKLPGEFVVDGEVCVLDSRGRSGFQLLQNYLKSGEGNLVYCVFDVLYRDGRDWRREPLLDRKRELKRLLQKSRFLQYGDHVAKTGRRFFSAAAQAGLEGVIAKRSTSPYRTGVRSRDWLKIKTHHRQEAVIAGFTEPLGGRQHLGALVLGVFESGKLVYIGHAGGGFDERTLADVYRRLKPLVRRSSPFAEVPKTNTPVTWVTPKLVCEVAFREWTGDGHMRQPIFIGLRDDKPARQVKRERLRG
jgi:bifunctional non-homologous end joining protein LigD